MININDIKIPIIAIAAKLLLIIVFHRWFSGFVGESEWRKPTPIPENFNNVYIWPPGVNWLGTPVSEDFEEDEFKKQVQEDYRKYLNNRKEEIRQNKERLNEKK